MTMTAVRAMAPSLSDGSLGELGPLRLLPVARAAPGGAPREGATAQATPVTRTRLRLLGGTVARLTSGAAPRCRSATAPIGPVAQDGAGGKALRPQGLSAGPRE